MEHSLRNNLVLSRTSRNQKASLAEHAEDTELNHNL